jgi:hypothetical protein
MTVSVKSYVSSLSTGDAVTFANMTLLPLFAPVQQPADGEKHKAKIDAGIEIAAGPVEVEYVTLEQGIESGQVHVEEMPGSGSVQEVVVVNDSPLPVVIIDGEEIIGAKQNRLVNTTLVAAANSRITIPVSCVEHQRWSSISHEFGHRGRIVPHRIRAKKMRSVDATLRRGEGHRGDQGEVWSDVHDVHMAFHVESPTNSLSDALDAREHDISEYLDSFPMHESQVGAVVAVNGRAMGFDVVGVQELYARLHRKIVHSYAAQAAMSQHADHARESEEAAADAARKLVSRAGSSQWKRTMSPGDSVELRASNKDITGTAVFHGSRLLHLVVSAVVE